jgi:tRNA nucleotidyltransferase/poly(A) polymerase
VAQFRKDGSYGDSRRPDSVAPATSFADDAARRDFTINAMAITPDGTLLDYFGGLDGLRAGCCERWEIPSYGSAKTACESCVPLD